MFLSSKSAVDSGAHNATDSLCRIDWSIDAESRPHSEIVDVVLFFLLLLTNLNKQLNLVKDLVTYNSYFCYNQHSRVK